MNPDQQAPGLPAGLAAGREALLARIPVNARRLLFVDGGSTGLAAAYAARNPGVGIIHAILGNGRQPADGQQIPGVRSLSLTPWAEAEDIAQALEGEQIDALVLDGGLERVVDPWALALGLHRLMSPRGVCIAAFNNVAHWSVLLRQLQGVWRYGGAEGFGREQLRFFSLDSALELLKGGGWSICDATPVQAESPEPDWLRVLTEAASRLGESGKAGRTDFDVERWIIRATVEPAHSWLNVVALGLRKMAGVTEARVDHPMAALATLPDVRVVWGAGRISIPRGWDQGVFILHRQFMHERAFQQSMAALAVKGWVLVADMDDDPHHWREFVESNFHAFRGVHAVTVSTEPMARIMRQWNPDVQVFANAVAHLPPRVCQPSPGMPVRVFFGALNRGDDWAGIMRGVVDAARALAGRVEFVVVHDRAFFEALPESCSKAFHKTLPLADYMALLSGCQLALLPLRDTEFNRLKSDLKLIECLAAGVVPICSPVVYGDDPSHRDFAWFATSAEEWRHALETLCADSDERIARADRGLAYVKASRMHSGQVGARAQYYRGLLADRERLERERMLRLTLSRGL